MGYYFAWVLKQLQSYMIALCNLLKKYRDNTRIFLLSKLQFVLSKFGI